MEEDGEETPRSPFWLQSTTNVRRMDLYRRRISSFFFNSLVLIIILLFFALISLLVIIPFLIDFSSHFFKPNFVKKSWDSVNLVLVLIALAFGFLTRNINNSGDDKLSFDNGFRRSGSDLSPATPVLNQSQWYDFPDQPIGSGPGLRRQRTSSSYPDLRELSPPWNHRVAAYPWRFSDDTYVSNYRRGQDPDAFVRLPQEDLYSPPPQPPIPEEEINTPPPQPQSPPSPPPQPPAPTPVVKKKTKRTYRNVGEEGGERSSSSSGPSKILSPETEPLPVPVVQDLEEKEVRGERRRGRRARSSEPKERLSPVIDPVPEPSSPPPVFQDSDQKSVRKRNGANATKEFFTSFYHKKKKKRQRQRSVDNLDTLLHHSQPPPLRFHHLPPPSPPPPPPPPPPPVLHNLFVSKKGKKTVKASSAPPPPPPLPPYLPARAPRPTTTARVAPFMTDKPRAPVKMSSFNSIDDSSSGGESPLKRIPPPPPPPPFKMRDWKFPVEGDFVRLHSTLSSRSVSPDGDEAQSPSSDVDAAAASPLFCPSPDVDTKADTFIARFRAGLKLEKINSVNQNHGVRMSNLGPGPSQSKH